APRGAVLLVGSATPLYVMGDVRYATTYDRNLLTKLILELPDEPTAWLDGLRDAGVRWIVVDQGELTRLGNSGWLDPALSRDALAALAEQLGQPVAIYGNGRKILLRVPDVDGDE
ncbi:MAG: hypothetical protein AAF747_07965, partial [Planctomycetota bacterium]